jgi:SOS-response transcriptional repressor LexA
MKHAALDQIRQTGTIELPADVLPHEHVVAFGVTGDCMNKDGINDGDLVLVDPERAPAHGEIGVFMIRNQDGGLGLTLKGLDLSEGTRLVPSNPAHPPIVIEDDDELFVVGTVFAVVHRIS